MFAVLLAVVLAADGGVDAGLPIDAGMLSKAQLSPPVLPTFPTTLPDGGVLAPCKQKQVVCFSPEGDCDLQVVQLIDRTLAGGTLDLSIYSLNRESIVSALLRARARNVRVRLVLDSMQIGDPKEQPQLQRLLAAGVPMKRDTHSGIMHNKFVVRDAQEFLTGSFNFTNNASENNDENMLVWDCQRLALVYATKFEQLWGKFKDATDSVMKDGG